MSHEPVRYVVDPDGVVVARNDAWSRFAHAAGAPDVARWSGTLAEAISGREVLALWDAVLASVRERQGAASFRVRCDGPSVARTLRLSLAADDRGYVTFESSVDDARPTRLVPLFDATKPRSAEHLRSCSWCNRFHIGRWVEPAVAVAELGLLAAPVVPAITHTICETCAAAVEEALADVRPLQPRELVT